MLDVECRSPHGEMVSCWAAAQSGFAVVGPSEPLEAFVKRLGAEAPPPGDLWLCSASNYIDHLSTFGLVGRSSSETSPQLHRPQLDLKYLLRKVSSTKLSGSNVQVEKVWMDRSSFGMREEWIGFKEELIVPSDN